MRKLFITALLASAVATPGLAAPNDRDMTRAERQQAREDRQEAREERQAREPRAERAEPAVELRVRDNDGPVRAEAVGRADRQDVEAIRAARGGDGAQRIEDR